MNELPTADVNPVVAEAIKEDQVSRLQLRALMTPDDFPVTTRAPDGGRYVTSAEP